MYKSSFSSLLYSTSVVANMVKMVGQRDVLAVHAVVEEDVVEVDVVVEEQHLEDQVEVELLGVDLAEVQAEDLLVDQEVEEAVLLRLATLL